MIKLLKSIVSKFSKTENAEENQIEPTIENRISVADGEQIGISQYGGIWIKYQELVDYQFMNVLIVGKIKHKTFKGCQLVFTSQNSELKLTSDTREIESDFTDVSNRYVTQMSFDITNENIDIITNNEAIKVDLIFEKNTESFETFKD